MTAKIELDPNAFDFKQQLESLLLKYAEEYSIEKYPSEHRHHLGISIIGDECWRKLWYGFRWVKLEQHEGRMKRLFQRGHNEEEKFETFLYWCGFHTRSIDPETGKQYRLSLVEGHYGGSTDGISLISFAQNLPIICEYKTHNNKSFTELKEKKLQLSKPQHYAQTCGYGKNFKIQHALYCAVNKDTDEWYFEFIKLDWNYADELEKKAAEIIYAKAPPRRISENPAYYKCKFCTYNDICFNNAPVEINCRSCKFATPVENGNWHCNNFNSIIPKDYIAKGCDRHMAIQ